MYAYVPVALRVVHTIAIITEVISEDYRDYHADAFTDSFTSGDVTFMLKNATWSKVWCAHTYHTWLMVSFEHNTQQSIAVAAATAAAAALPSRARLHATPLSTQEI